MISGSNPGVGEPSQIHSHRPWGPPYFLYNGYQTIPVGKAGKGVALTIQRHPVSTLKKYTSTPPLCLRRFKVKLYTFSYHFEQESYYISNISTK
jgi:hypothetical protein